MIDKGYINKYVPFSVKLGVEIAVDLHNEEVKVFDAIINTYGDSDIKEAKDTADRRRDYILGLQELKEEEEKKKDKAMEERLNSLPQVVKVKKGKKTNKKKYRKGPEKFKTRSQIKIEKIKGGGK